MSSIEEVFVPMYLFHRYQIEAASKVLGGLDYSYAIKGDGQVITKMIDPTAQMKALDALMNTVSPQALVIPEKLLKIIPPRAFGYPRTRETFNVRTGLTFDALGIAETAANMTLSFVLNAERAGRLVEYNGRDNSQPGLINVIDKIITSTWKSTRMAGYSGEVQRVVEKMVMYHLMQLASNPKAMEQARAISLFKLTELSGWMENRIKSERNSSQKAHLVYSPK